MIQQKNIKIMSTQSENDFKTTAIHDNCNKIGTLI